MKPNQRMAFAALLTAGLLLLSGCVSTTAKLDDPDMPQWVYKGSGAYEDNNAKVFYGVGIASGINNKALLFSTADNRARAEVAKVLETYVALLARDYIASATAGDMSTASEEQHVEQALKTFSKTTLYGAAIIDHWQDPDDKTMHSLCRLDLVFFKKALDEYRELDDQLREYVRDNAETMHDELENMADK